MKIILKVLILYLLVMMLLPLSALASVITNYQYQTPITITNSGSADTNVLAAVSINSTAWIATNMLSADASDAVMKDSTGNDVVFMPGYAGNPWITFVSIIGADAQQMQYLYTNNVTGGAIRYFPGTTGMTLADASATGLEWGNSGNITWQGRFDPSSTGYFLNKVNAITVQGNGAGGITAGILDSTDNFSTDTWTDVGTQIHVNTASSRLDYVALDILAPDQRSYKDYGLASDTSWSVNFTFNNTSRVGTSYLMFSLGSALGNYQGFAGDDIGVAVTGAANPLVGIYYHDGGGAAVFSATMGTNLATTYYATLTRNPAILATLSVFSDAARTTHIAGSPITRVIPATVINLRYLQASGYNFGGAAGNTLTGWIDSLNLSYFPGLMSSVFVAGVSAAEHTVGVYLTGGFLGITVDGAAPVTTPFGGSLPDNGNAWNFVTGGIMPYMYTQEQYVGVTLKQHIEWRYGATFLDTTANHNDTVPSFRTTSSNAYITVTVGGSQTPYSSTGPAPTSYSGIDIIPTNPAQPNKFYHEGGLNFPGGNLILVFATALNEPVELFLYPLAIGTSLALGLFAMAKTHNEKRGMRGSLLILGGTTEAGLVFWVYMGGGVISGWILIPFAVVALAGLLMKNPYNAMS